MYFSRVKHVTWALLSLHLNQYKFSQVPVSFVVFRMRAMNDIIYTQSIYQNSFTKIGHIVKWWATFRPNRHLYDLDSSYEAF